MLRGNLSAARRKLTWHLGVPTVAQASLGTIAVPSGGQYVMATILGTCVLSFAVTHLLYFLAVGQEIAALVKAVSRIFRMLYQKASGVDRMQIIRIDPNA